MTLADGPRVDSEVTSEFARLMSSGRDSTRLPSPKHSTGRLDIDPENVKNGLGRLVLTLVKIIHELLERQAIRRIDSGSLADEEIERLGLTLMKQAEELERLRNEFGLEEDDLNLDLGPLGKFR